jgi:hypothetical protein
VSNRARQGFRIGEFILRKEIVGTDSKSSSSFKAFHSVLHSPTGPYTLAISWDDWNRSKPFKAMQLRNFRSVFGESSFDRRSSLDVDLDSSLLSRIHSTDRSDVHGLLLRSLHPVVKLVSSFWTRQADRRESLARFADVLLRLGDAFQPFAFRLRYADVNLLSDVRNRRTYPERNGDEDAESSVQIFMMKRVRRDGI